jgi:hypothetical protein
MGLFVRFDRVFILPLAASQGGLKGATFVFVKLTSSCLPSLAPFRTVLDDPVGQRPFKADITAGLFGFNPLVLEDFLPFRLEFPIKRGILQQIVGQRWLFRLVRHKMPLRAGV